MSKSKFKVQKGLAFVITTGEPVFVTELEGNNAYIVRPINTTDGVRHTTEVFPLDQLETRHEQIKRNMEAAEYAEALKMDMEDRLMAQAQGKGQQQLTQALNPSMKLTPINRTDA